MIPKLLVFSVASALVLTASTTPTLAGPACCKPQTATNASAQAGLIDTDLETVLTFINEWSPSGLKMMKAGGYIKLENPSGEVHTASTLSEKTGVQLTDSDMEQVIDTLIARSGKEPQTQTCAAPHGAACSELTLASDYDACLSSGGVVSSEPSQATYAKAMAGDGSRYTERALPDFTMKTLDGTPVRVSAFDGKPALFAFLSDNCGHSMRTFSTLQRVKKRYPDLTIVTVFAEPHDIEVLRGKLDSRTVRTDVGLSPDAVAATGIDIVPTLFFVDAKRIIREVLVGEKMEKSLAQSLDGWLDGDPTRVGLNEE